MCPYDDQTSRHLLTCTSKNDEEENIIKFGMYSRRESHVFFNMLSSIDKFWWMMLTAVFIVGLSITTTGLVIVAIGIFIGLKSVIYSQQKKKSQMCLLYFYNKN